MNRLAISGVSIAGSGLAALAYGGLIERNAFTLRRFDVPVLAPGSPPLRVLHVSDLHITAGQARKQRWISALADLEPDLVVNTGDTISDPSAIPEILRTLEPLGRLPGRLRARQQRLLRADSGHARRATSPGRSRAEFGPTHAVAGTGRGHVRSGLDGSHPPAGHRVRTAGSRWRWPEPTTRIWAGPTTT